MSASCLLATAGQVQVLEVGLHVWAPMVAPAALVYAPRQVMPRAGLTSQHCCSGSMHTLPQTTLPALTPGVCVQVITS